MEILLAQPRGFCAGVERAITIVERALARYGTPVYVRHEIVHNKTVVANLKAKGARFVEDLEEVPDGCVVIFSAHGVPRAVVEEAGRRSLRSVDATCPLVKKVHTAVARHERQQEEIILIGHRGHPEVVGTMGQLPEGRVKLVGSVADVAALQVADPARLAYTTQTTLSVQETRDIIEALRGRFPEIRGPSQGDLCYATTNRQQAVLELTAQIDLLLVIGSANSSNSSRLRELGASKSIPSHLIDSHLDLRDEWFRGVDRVGISSGASAPESLVLEVVGALLAKFPGSTSRNLRLLEENVHFPLPPELS
ncbi:MAG: 4-hydroxy-3-methylbut-2-enyl diphosphate reductase [Spirochaetes bacterium]|nr:4-hydroxy-3-methylbut-2-enyl diphosphate reductase [Spirochaetota bacterium]